MLSVTLGQLGGCALFVSHKTDRFSTRLTGGTLLRMAQRLVIPSREEVDAELTIARPWWQFSARFNVAISQSIPVARMHERESEGVMMRWGLAHKTAGGSIDFTACGSVRSDALKSGQDLCRMWVGGQRGIVPVAGFYLWQRAPAGYDQPYYVRLVNRPVFGAAALWSAQKPMTKSSKAVYLSPSMPTRCWLKSILRSGRCPRYSARKTTLRGSHRAWSRRTRCCGLIRIPGWSVTRSRPT